MKKYLIHISDVHFQKNIEENQNIVLDAFFKDLKEKICDIEPLDIFFIISGDIVMEGGDTSSYDAAFDYLDKQLSTLGIDKDHRICVPGNHDLSTIWVKNNKTEHCALVASKIGENDFNDYINKNDFPELIGKKFENYFNFQRKFAFYGLDPKHPTISTYKIANDISIYCLNTALFSSGGFDGINDIERLCIDTRTLHKNLSLDQNKCKIMIMHHNHSWFIEWAKNTFKTCMHANFSLCLSGHIHDQEASFIVKPENVFVECYAPQLFSDKNDDLGYAIICINNGVVDSINYRHWAKKHNKFLTGSIFSGTDSGIVNFKHEIINNQTDNHHQNTLRILDDRLSEAMKAYSNGEKIWLNRRLSKKRNAYSNLYNNPEDDISLSNIISAPHSMFITAPPQFGLSCLAHYMAKVAWREHSKFWIYFDLEKIRLQDIERHIIKEKKLFGLDSVNCILLDSWKERSKNNIKIIEKIKQYLADIPIIIMQTIESNQIFANNPTDDLMNEITEIISLLPLNRSEMRPAIEMYCKEKTENEDNLIQRLVSDMEVLNMHRTPLNCFTLLIASISDNYTIINRTKLLEKVLSIIFEENEIPNYFIRPDVKDCEYVLGCFCEDMIRNEQYIFAKEFFETFIKDRCKKKFLSIDFECLFKILYDNNIVIKIDDNHFKFKHTFWIYYFAAHRMKHNEDFAQYIFENKKYIDFPEIIEFYTGIDRKRDDALKVICEDLKSSCETVNKKTGLPMNMAPYDSLKWKPNTQILNKVKEEIRDDVQESKLPVEIKDKFADQAYNPLKPFDQDVHTILNKYSVLVLMRDIRAASMALRNSDYANAELKIELMKYITRSWEEVARVIVALSPILAMNGSAGYGGASFILSGDFGESVDEKMKTIILKIPENLIRWFQNDILSHKLGPLFFEQLKNDETQFRKHLIALILVNDRPVGWKDEILNYIASVSKNSFYLFDIFNTLQIEYQFGFAVGKELRDLGYLIKACVAKHETGVKKPGTNAIKKIPNKVLTD